jgi:stringent starvation protein B
MTQTEQPGKAEVVRFLLQDEGRVMLCIDATQSGVEVPRRLLKDQGLRLILNRQMPQRIDIGPETIESELRFSGIPHYCIIPHAALWGAFNPDTGHGLFWPESMPEAIRHNFERHNILEGAAPPEAPDSPSIFARPTGSGKKEPVAGQPPEPQKPRPQLTVIEGEGSESETPKPSNPPRKRDRSHLRLVE